MARKAEVKRKVGQHSPETTKRNKERRAETRARRLEAAARRRANFDTYTDPRTGKLVKRRTVLQAIFTKRDAQATRIHLKAAARRAFAKLSAKEKREHREAGQRQFR